jgi:polyhydroxybutyrate depolymerase
MIVRGRRARLALGSALTCLTICGCASASLTAPSASAPLVQPVAGYTATRVMVRTPKGLLRSYLLYLPPGGAKHSPLVLVFHGADSTAEGAASESDFVPVFAQRGVVVAFLQGYDDTWNEEAGDTPAHAAHINDVEFTAAVIKQLESGYSIDRTRVAAAGISNGALLTELLGCRLAGSLTLIAPAAGQLPVSVSPTCRPARAISVLETHGTNDESIPYDGGRFYGVGGGTTVLSAPANARRWASLDRCTRSAESSVAAPQPTMLSTYSKCRAGVVVELRTLEGAGHAWAQDAGALIAEFLHEHPRAPAR